MIYDVIVIGGGQAGLSIGYYLKQTKLSFLILDKESAVSENWKNRNRKSEIVLNGLLTLVNKKETKGKLDT